MPSGRMEARRILVIGAAAAAICGAAAAVFLSSSNPAFRLGVFPLIGLVGLPLAVAWPELFVYGGLLLASSDRFLTVEIANLTLKPSHILFTVALAGVAAGGLPPRSRTDSGSVPRLIFVSVAGLLALHLLASVLSERPLLGLKSLAVPLVNALVPMAAILSTGRDRRRTDNLLAAFVLSQFLVAVYGVYQFAATAAGLPPGLRLETVVGGIYRASGLSFEPALFAAYMVTGLPLLISDAVRQRRRIGLSPLLIIAVVLIAFVLALSRAAFIALPVIFACAWLINGHAKSKTAAAVLIPMAAAAVAIGTVGGSTNVSAPSILEERAASILDPSDPSSNAPRLELYRSVLTVIRDNPLFGVGPGSLGYELPRFNELFQRGKEFTATANNIWLQAAVDYGLPALPLVAGVLIGAWSAGFGTGRKDNDQAPTFPDEETDTVLKSLIAGCLVFMLVNGSLVSLLWDIKFWTVLALGLAVRKSSQARSALVRHKTQHGQDGEDAEQSARDHQPQAG